jgi:hypothetical protein
LFSAALSVLLAVTVLDLKPGPNPQETAAFYLKNIYQLQVLTHPIISPPFNSFTPPDPPATSPPKYIIWVNSLWFLSLTISLTCAMLATLVQQWARRFLRNTQPPQCSPHERARIRAFFADGVDDLRLDRAVEALPTMLHLSLFLFFAGLLIYLFNLNHTVFSAVVGSVCFSALAYIFITFMPLIRRESPYYTSLSSIIGLLRDMEKMVKETVQEQSKKIDGDIVKCILDTVVDDHQLARFLESIPGFFRSPVVNHDLRESAEFWKEKLEELDVPRKVTQFLERTRLSNFLPDLDKMRRLVVCAKVADAVGLPGVSASTLNDIFPWDQYQMLRSVEMGQSLRSRANNDQGTIGLCAQSIVAGIISNVQETDKGWIALAADQLDKSEDDIRAYLELEHGKNNVLLANLTHITRQIFDFSLGDNLSREMAYASTFVLQSLSNFVIQNTDPGLRAEFRDLWNEIVAAPDNDVITEIRDILLNRHPYLNDL